MKRQSILFAIHYMELGGAEMSLLGLLESLDYSRVEVDLFVYVHRGDLMRHIPSQVHLLPELKAYAQIERPIKDVVRDGYLRIAMARLKAKLQFRRGVSERHPEEGSAIFAYVARNLVKILPDINPAKEYDVAVSYLAPHDYVLKKVRAKEKVAWIHTDYSKIDVDSDMELPVWDGYDRIVSISPDVTRSFLKRFPSLADKIEERSNRVPENLVKEQACKMTPQQVEAEMPKAPGRVNLLSVGRFCHAKNYDNVPDICRRIRGKGIDVRWYLIGYGGDEARIKRIINETEMQEHVIILGKRDNPYPYMKACDIYVQPSRYEGCPMTVLEAIALYKPVILTAFPTAGSVVDVHPGCHVVPMDNAGCAEGIADFVGKMFDKARILPSM